MTDCGTHLAMYYLQVNKLAHSLKYLKQVVEIQEAAL
jgi:hypothetical protein